MPPGASRTPGRSTAKPPCPNRQAREPHNGPPRASMSSGTDFAKDRARNLLRRSNDRALQRPRSLGTRSFPRLQSIVTQWPARSRARWPQARPSVTLDDRQLAAGVEGLSVSSSANADDPVTTELGKGHYFASIACSVVTGCPACAGHDDEEVCRVGKGAHADGSTDTTRFAPLPTRRHRAAASAAWAKACNTVATPKDPSRGRGRDAHC